VVAHHSPGTMVTYHGRSCAELVVTQESGVLCGACGDRWNREHAEGET